MVSETTLLYVTAIIAIAAMITMLVMNIIVVRSMGKAIDKMEQGVKKVYELFSFLHKESEERIGRANVMVTQCTSGIEKAALASQGCTDAAKECAQASQKMLILINNIDNRYSSYVDKLREEKARLENELEKERAADRHSGPQYVTHNHTA